MDEFRFASPYVLLLLLALPLLAAFAWRRAGPPAAVRVGSVAAAAASRRTWRLRFEPSLRALRLLAVALLIIALARPQAGEATAETEHEGIDIVLAFDVSSSMTQPFVRSRSRIDAAKEVLSQFVSTRENDRVGLVAFQGTSLTMSPLTTDYGAVAQGVGDADRLDLEDGTAIGVALGESVNVLRNSTSPTRIVILLTDGENNVHDIEPLAAARIAEKLGVRVYTVGVVSRGSTGREVTNVDEEALRQMAELTGGTYSPAADLPALTQIYADIDALEKSRVEGRVFTRFDEIAPYLLAAAAALLAVEIALRYSLFRRLT